MKHEAMSQNPYVTYKEGYGWVIKSEIIKREMGENLLTVAEICAKYGLKIYHRYPTNLWHRENTKDFKQLEGIAINAAGMRRRGVKNPEYFYSKYVSRTPGTTKMIINLEQFYTLFYTLGKTRAEILEICKVGSKIWSNTLKQFKVFFPKEYKEASTIKHARSKFGNTFGNSEPQPLIGYDQLKSLVDKGESKERIKEILSISDFILHRNLQYHGLELSYYKQRTEVNTGHHLPGIETLNIMEKINPGILDKFKEFYYSDPEKVAEDLYKSYLSILNIQYELRRIGSLVNSRILLKKGVRKFAFTQNRGEYLVAISLLDSKIEFIHSYPLGEYFFDFFIPKKNTLLEIDGSIHKLHLIKSKDKEKLAYAESQGYKVVRVKYTGKTLKETEEFRELLSSEVIGVKA
jgi:very-short-patch-repair endonuclease